MNIGSTDLTRRAAMAGVVAGPGVAACRSPKTANFRNPGSVGSTYWATAADGQRIRYETFGTGPITLVLIHGWACDRTYWQKQIAAFSSQFRVLTLDLVGHGESDKCRTVWSIEGLGDDIARVVRAAAARQVVLIGHSMGGPVAIEAARRLGESVLGVVTVDILQSLAPPNLQDPPPLSVANFRSAGEPIIRKYMFTPHSDPVLVNRISRAMTSGSPQIAIALIDALNVFDGQAALAAIHGLPLTMINAAGQPIDSGALRQAHPKVRIFVVAGVGHFVMIEDPITFNALIASEVGQITGRIKVL